MRLHRKCLLASAGSHALLLLLLVAGSGFIARVTRPPPVEQDLAVLSLIPDILVDQPVVGGGEPPAGRSAEPPAAPAEPTPPAPPVETRPVPRPEPTPKPPKAQKPAVKPPDPERTVPSETATKPPPKPHVVEPNLSPVVRQASEAKSPTREQREAQAAADAAAQARRLAQAFQSRVNSAVSGLGSRLSSSTTVTVPGGTGGATYASYSLFVKSVYQWAWRPPGQLTDESATATVRVVIARDGRVVSSRIESPSNVPVLDRSVRAVLDRVTTIGRPFPEGAQDDERTFLIDFNVKAKPTAG